MSKRAAEIGGILSHACCPGDTIGPAPSAPGLRAQGRLYPCRLALKWVGAHWGTSEVREKGGNPELPST